MDEDKLKGINDLNFRIIGLESTIKLLLEGIKDGDNIIIWNNAKGLTIAALSDNEKYDCVLMLKKELEGLKKRFEEL